MWRRWNNPPPDLPLRRAVHLGVGTSLPLLALVLPGPWALLPPALLLALWGVPDLARLRWPALNRLFWWAFRPFLKEAEARRPTGATWLLLSALAVLGLFPRPVAVLALLYLSLGDPASALVGRRWGRHRLGGKSLEGALALLAVALAVGLALGPRVGAGPWWVPALGALAVALADLLPLRVDDNLTLPLAGAGAMALAGALAGP